MEEAMKFESPLAQRPSLSAGLESEAWHAFSAMYNGATPEELHIFPKLKAANEKLTSGPTAEGETK